MQDVRQAGALRHEHIANVWASYTSEDAGYILSDFVGEHTLSTFIDHRTPMQYMRIPVAQRPALLLEWIHCLSDALASLHHRGTAHAAIRPSNILISHDNHIAFADVGTLRTFQRGKKPQKTETYDYAAPESQVSKAPIVVPSSPPVSSMSAFNRLRKMSSSTSGSSTEPSTGSSSRSNSLCHTAPTTPTTSPRSMAKGRSNSFTTTISAAFSSSPPPTRPSSSFRNFSRHMLSNEPCPYPSVPTSPRTIQSQMSMPQICSALPNPDFLQDLPEPAPEMSDIYSLACVFLDILTFLLRGKLNDFVRFRASRTATSPSDRTKGKVRLDHSFHCNPEKVEAWIDTLREESERRSEEVFRGMPDLLRLIQRMMAQNALLRPSAIVTTRHPQGGHPTEMDPFHSPPTTRPPEAGPATADALRRPFDQHVTGQQTPQGQFAPRACLYHPRLMLNTHPLLVNQGASERATHGFGQHQAAFQHTPQMQPFQQPPNMPQHQHMMRGPPAMPMAMTGPGINLPGLMHPQQPNHQQPPRGFTPGYGPMQQMPMGVVGPNVEYNQTHAPLMPQPYQQMHAPSQSDGRYPAGVYPGQNFPPAPHQQQRAVPNQQHRVPRPEGDPPLIPGLPLPGPGHPLSWPGAQVFYQPHPELYRHAPWSQIPAPKLKDFSTPSPAAYLLHGLNPAVPLAYACRFVHMYCDRFADVSPLHWFSEWCQEFEKSRMTPQQFFDRVDGVLSFSEEWDLRELFSLFAPAAPNAVRYPLFLQPSVDGGNGQDGNYPRAYGQGAYNQAANASAVNAQVANAQAADARATSAQPGNDQGVNDRITNNQAANVQAANAQDVGTQTLNTQNIDEQSAKSSVSSQPGHERLTVHQAEAEGSSTRAAITRHTEELEHNGDQKTPQGKLLIKLPVASPNSTASPRGKKRAAKSDDDEHENAGGSGAPDSNAVNKSMTKKQKKKESPASSLKASDSAEQESPDQSVQDEIDFRHTLHLSGSGASNDSDSPTPKQSKQSRPKGNQKKTAGAPARKRVKLGDMPADSVPHVGPVFPSRRAIFARDSRPYIHSICGQGFKHMDDVKSHHYGSASRTVGCPSIRDAVAKHGRKAIESFPAWDTHESCKIRCGDIKYQETKDGYVILNQESWDKVQKAIDAGEEYKRMMNEGGGYDDAMQDQDDVVAEDDGDAVSEDVNEEEQDEDTKNIDPFLLSSEAELRWTFAGAHAYAAQPFGNKALLSDTPEQMSKGPMKTESPVTGTTMPQRGAMAIPIMNQPPAHYAANTSFHGPNLMGQPFNYQMPGATKPQPTLSPTTTPTKSNVSKRKVVKAGWDEKDEHDEEKLAAAAHELKMRNKK
ncbi:hypothetical protein KC319_g6431 [Hortaea werneckii]|nr:hypothetical protein KC319_g6431 [Hortaea werneckii]